MVFEIKISLSSDSIMKCSICRIGETRPGMTTVTLEREGLILVMKEVPAEICINCGEDYVGEAATRKIIMMADKMSQSGVQIDVRRYTP
jgi:YgiT-type zinc finger domain-containing protein